MPKGFNSGHKSVAEIRVPAFFVIFASLEHMYACQFEPEMTPMRTVDTLGAFPWVQISGLAEFRREKVGFFQEWPPAQGIRQD